MNINEIKRKGIHIFNTKQEAINYISKFGFKYGESLTIFRTNHKKWIVMYKVSEVVEDDK